MRGFLLGFLSALLLSALTAGAQMSDPQTETLFLYPLLSPRVLPPSGYILPPVPPSALKGLDIPPFTPPNPCGD